MALSLKTNLAAINAAKDIGSARKVLEGSVGKISSGLRINQAGDDAAGLSVATKISAFNSSLKQAMRNTNDGISMMQTADGTLGELSNIIIRMRELSTQATSETYNSDSREIIQKELGILTEEYQRLVTTANFDDVQLLNSANANYAIQVGEFNNSDNVIALNLASLNATLGNVGLNNFVANIASAGNMTQARSNLDSLDNALNSISVRRARLGAIQGRLESALARASQHSVSMTSTTSQILDVDYASESANMTRFQIQQQSGVAALSQAKNFPISVLSLLA